MDPGTHKTGIGLISAKGNQYRSIHYEVITQKPGTELPQRLLKIYKQIGAVIRQFQPEVLALENIFFGRDVPAMVKIGEARACAMLAASENQIRVAEYPPARVKESVAGNGRASKEQMQFMVQRLLHLDKALPEDSADALAVAICHVHSYRSLKNREVVMVL